MLNGLALPASLAASDTRVAGAPVETSTSVDAPRAWSVSLRLLVALVTICIRLPGSGSPSGSSMSHMATLFPSAPVSSWVRTDTGAMMRNSSSPSSSSLTPPASTRYDLTAPATMASMTSLTVALCSFLILLTSPSGICSQSNARDPLIGPLRLVLALWVNHPEDSDAAAARARSVQLEVQFPISEGAFKMPASTPETLRDISRTTSSVPFGAGLANQGFGSLISNSAVKSRRTAMRSTPDMPSIMQWWILAMSAKPSSSKPSTTYSSQSGFERSSCWDMSLPARSLSCSVEPGCGSAMCLTW